jgi:hypothetical protein
MNLKAAAELRKLQDTQTPKVDFDIDHNGGDQVRVRVRVRVKENKEKKKRKIISFKIS